MSDPGDIALAFQADWRRLHGDALPLGHMLRDTGIPWIRFHALPESQRYARTEVEYETVLARGNRLAGKMIGENTECWMVQSASAIESRPGSETALPAMRFRVGDDGDEWQARASLTTWQASRFDAVLTEIADDELDYVIWINRSNGAIFAPYDGGFDLFPATQADVERLRHAFGGWLPNNPEGL